MKIVRVRNRGRVSYTLLLEGFARIGIDEISHDEPFLRAQVHELNTADTLAIEGTPAPETSSNGNADTSGKSGDTKSSAVAEFRSAAKRLIDLLRVRVPLVAKFKPLLESAPPDKLCDLFVSAIDATFEERLAILNELDLEARFAVALKLVTCVD